MRGRNTENHSIEKDEEMPEYQSKQHIILRLIHEEKDIVFNLNEMNRRKKELNDEVIVLLAIVV